MLKSTIVGDEFLNHDDVDVRVAVAACLSETLKLTSPDPPYHHDTLEDIFSLIVSSFKNLDDMSSPSYEKRISILQSVNEVNAWAVMVGLDYSLVVPPSSAAELLKILENISKCLLKLQKAEMEPEFDLYWFVLFKSMRVLTKEDILNHEDVDVRVAAAACLTEAMYFTSPHFPFTRQELRDVFIIMASSFEGLDDISSPSYEKRIYILRNFDELDLWRIPVGLCYYQPLAKLPQTFLTTIREHHPKEVFEAMRDMIIGVVPYVTDQALTTILTYLRKGAEVPQVSRKLAEEALSNFDKFSYTLTNFKKNLIHAVISSGFSLEDYSDIVAKICGGKLQMFTLWPLIG
ncbi:unnamed protein product [Microthlaspi erraticum]|uniref:Uncharacterized protein n=1 Tax=Microthlaspi erraticum TaxID=1685480 RepID=A0A6D2K4L2_9BRAS|nr:unnamed protein product [Microthlaspi erraticum]CAA7054159.1 unnamed protein product [Microthlaspi erraticum]